MPLPPSAKKFFFYTDSTYFSGAEKSFAILAASSIANGHTVHLFCTPVVADRLTQEVPTEQVTATVTRSKLSWGWYRNMKQLLNREKPDILVVNMWSPYANTLALLAAKATNTRVVTIYHYYQERRQITGLLKPVRFFAYRFAARLADTILTVSEAHHRVLTEDFGFPKDKVSVLYNGLFSPQSEPQYTDHEPRRLITVGSLEPDKGYAFLLRCLAKVTAPFSLTIVGDGPEREKLEQLAKDISQPVTFAGLQKDVNPLYVEHDLFVHPSYFENLSMGILEALSHGLAVVANDAGGNRELISPQEGWLLKIDDEAAWIQAITEAVTMPLTEKRMAAYRRWKENFTAEKQYEAFMGYIDKLPHES